ncbi:hypothetical protein AC578_9209 [Pseudocercospora eumusae]|uniref:Uncharacterized protein n=1 Tax=Pseudocercospora eumusae TaxID=321146 RepID=A0A139HV41_9PEZI|nr:hypothetical protein AC578_9209 [Pseudocercospora eumusae]
MTKSISKKGFAQVDVVKLWEWCIIQYLGTNQTLSGVAYRSDAPVLFELPAIVQERHTPFVPPTPGAYTENFMALMITFIFPSSLEFIAPYEDDVVWDNCWDVLRNALAQHRPGIFAAQLFLAGLIRRRQGKVSWSLSRLRG